MVRPYSEDPDDLRELLDTLRANDPRIELQRVRRAFYYSEEGHKGKKRRDGAPYITHPLRAAQILAELNMDEDTIIACLCHDLVEDTNIQLSDIEREFGKDVAFLVEGVTKLKERRREKDSAEPTQTRKRRSKSDEDANNFRKMLMAMARDIRVIIIKFADRQHNMETLDAMEPDDRLRIANETMEIYAPLAARLGIWQFKWKLEDLAFKYLYPQEYSQISERVARTRNEREKLMNNAVVALKERLERTGIDAEVQGRTKHLWSIYQKMVRFNTPYEEIYDLIALRVIVNTVSDCFHALGVVHEMWCSIPNLFTDHINNPKPNGYQSLHTKVIGPHSEPMEVQIRTWDMHHKAEYGFAAHWQYKEGGAIDESYMSKMADLRQRLFTISSAASNSKEFKRSVIDELFSDQVWIFTPKKDVIDLPKGSTPIDVAYHIHTELGNHTAGAKVNGRIVPLNYELKNGDIVDILSRQNASPNLDWLRYAKTNSAKAKIRSYLRKVNLEKNARFGKELIEREIKYYGIDPRELLGEEKLVKVAQELRRETMDDLLAAVGEGLLSVSAVVNRLRGFEAQQPSAPALPEQDNSLPEHQGPTEVSADGFEALMLKRARCCYPLPGDDVAGYTTRGRGIMIHLKTCPNLISYLKTEPERVMPINWRALGSENFNVPLSITTINKPGVLAEVTNVLAEMKVNIKEGNIRSTDNNMAVLNMYIEVPRLDVLQAVIEKISSQPNVVSVIRLEASPSKSKTGTKKKR